MAQGRVNELLAEILNQADDGLDDDDLPPNFHFTDVTKPPPQGAGPDVPPATSTGAAPDVDGPASAAAEGADAGSVGDSDNRQTADIDAILAEFEAQERAQAADRRAGSGSDDDGSRGPSPGARDYGKEVGFGPSPTGTSPAPFETPYRQTELELAAHRENRLLMQGNREMVSPLQVKRHLRTKSRSYTQSLTHKHNPSGPSVTAGIVKVEPKPAISQQLEKNVQYSSHGPGLPTAVSIHSKFIAIGTSRSLVRRLRWCARVCVCVCVLCVGVYLCLCACVCLCLRKQRGLCLWRVSPAGACVRPL